MLTDTLFKLLKNHLEIRIPNLNCYIKKRLNETPLSAYNCVCFNVYEFVAVEKSFVIRLHNK